MWLRPKSGAPLVVIVVQLLSFVQLFAAPWTAAHQASPSFSISQSLLTFMSVESVMLSNHLILSHPLLQILQQLCEVNLGRSRFPGA